MEDTGSARDVTVQGERKDVNTIFIKLRIADSTGLLLLLVPIQCVFLRVLRSNSVLLLFC